MRLGRWRHHRDAAVGTWRAARAPALLHVIAKPSHFARTERWLKGSARRAPAVHGAQAAVRLGCVRAGRAASGSGAWLLVAAAPSSMASTAWMGLKPASHGSHHWPPRVLTLQRRRGMDAAAQAWGPSHGWAQQRQRSPMRLPLIMPACREMAASAELVAPWRTRGAPSIVARM